MNNIYLNKYLKKRSLSNIGKPHKKIEKKCFDFFIVIPCYNEFDYIFQTLESIDKQNQNILNKTLVIIVINNSQKDSCLDNNKTYQKLILQKYNFNFIAIDCFSQKYAIPEKLSGVGYARKVGLDFSLKYISSNQSILCCLDADTLISNDYLDIIKQCFEKKINAAVINFKHQKSKKPIIEKGIRKYEKLIKNIAKKIESTGSPYGYVSMGSTIVCNVKAYIACGGMNTKKATEDFYFLQSLAKYTKINKINNVLVFPSSRDENRVYLGTGFRMNEFLKNKSFKNLEFSDQSYIEIKKIINTVNKYWNNDYNFIYKELNKILDYKTLQFLNEQNFEKVWIRFKQNAKNKKQFILFFHQWFDGFSVMKLLKKLNNY